MAEIEATGARSLNHYVASLLDQMHSGTPERRFALVQGDDTPFSVKDIAKWLLNNLGNELFAWGFQSVLGALGIGSNSEILRQLEEINAKLDELKNMVAGLQRDVAEAKVEIVNTPLVAAMANITDQYSYLTWAAQHLSCVSSTAAVDAGCKDSADGIKATIRGRIDAILDPNAGVVAQFALLDTSLAGLPTEPGVLRRWHDYLKTTRQFYSPAPNADLMRLNAYYETYQLMAAHLIVEAYVARQDADGKPIPDRESGILTLQQLDGAATVQETLVASLRLANEDVVLDQRNKLTWLRRPVTYFSPPEWISDDSGSGFYRYPYDEQAAQTCQAFADSGYAGLAGWRQPTESELHAVTKDSPGTGNAQSNDGVFAWLVDQGFAWAPGDGTYNQRGFLAQTAYFSSTWSGTDSHEALWDGGVDNVCNRQGSCYGNSSPLAGVWCVTDAAPE